MNYKKMISFLWSFAVVFLLISPLSSCKSDNKKDGKDEETESAKSEAEMTKAEDSGSEAIMVTTNAMEFKTKDEIPSGWNTFKYRNLSNETHFMIFEKYPEGKGLEDAKKEVGPVFQKGMDLLIEGKNDEAMAEFGNLPEWFQQIEMYGGTGLISPQSTAQSTVKLDPGTYLIECYVKMPNGAFHSLNGMWKEIKVTDEDSGNKEPQADYTIEISAENGISFDQNVSSGEHRFAVKFVDQKVHENFVEHDVHLVRVGEGSDISALNDWMNWVAPEGLQTPAPKGFKFLGGLQEMAAGKTGYFTADLRPGTYALISEVPDPQGKGMLKTFTVK